MHFGILVCPRPKKEVTSKFFFPENDAPPIKPIAPTNEKSANTKENMQPNVLESFASISSGIKRANKAIALHKTVEPTKIQKY